MKAIRFVPSLVLVLGILVGSEVAYGGPPPGRPTEPGAVVAINCPPPNPKLVTNDVSDC
jgi:hypothetical protein